MSDLAGGLNIALQRSGAAMGVAIASTRPLGTPRVFVGRGFVETARDLPRLFSICATAQASACTQALEQALGLTPDPETTAVRAALLAAETVKEHLWRLLLGWPQLVGEPPAAVALREVLAAWAGMRAAVREVGEPFAPGARARWPDGIGAAVSGLARAAEMHVFGVPAADWLVRTTTTPAFAAWAEAGATPAARLVQDVVRRGEAALGRCDIDPLPDLTPLALGARLTAPGAQGFIAQPDWGGVPRETSPFARIRHLGLVAGLASEQGNGLLARQAAVLSEVAGLLTLLRDGPGACSGAAGARTVAGGRGIGLAQVQAARGLLVHRVELDSGLVRDYRILAPTEWNFHPRGVVARGLAGLSPAETDAALLRQAGLYVTLVDPCVDYRLSVV